VQLHTCVRVVVRWVI